MNFKKTVLNLSFLLIISCNSNGKIEVIDQSHNSLSVSSFPKTIQLTQKLDSFVIEKPLLQIRAFAATSNLLFALTNDKSSLIEVFNKESLGYLGSIGFEGQGPEDLEFYRINAGSFNTSEDELFVADKRYFRTIPLAGLSGRIQENSVLIQDKWPIPGNLMPLNDPFLSSKKTVLGKKNNSLKHLIEYSPNTSSLIDSVEYPSFKSEIPLSANYSLYWCDLSATRDGNKVAIAYLYFPAIRLFDFKTQKYLDINFKPEVSQIETIPVTSGNRGIDNSNMIMYYASVKVSNNKVYALYQESAFKQENSRVTRFAFKSPVLHVFDWSGNPIQEIMLPEWVDKYTVSPDDSYLYLNHPEKENYIYRLTLNN